MLMVSAAKNYGRFRVLGSLVAISVFLSVSLWVIHDKIRESSHNTIHIEGGSLGRSGDGRPLSDLKAERSVLVDGQLFKSTQPAAGHTVECFVSGNEKFCLPSWIIIAGAKSGSSALWQYVCDNVGSNCANKEIHYHGGPLIPFIKGNMGQDDSFGSGNMGTLEPIQDFIERNTRTKFIALLRNPVDFAYAAWHFWCDKLFDGHDCTDWASTAKNKTERTPENFEMLLEKHCVGKGKCFVRGWKGWELAASAIDRLPANRLVTIRSEILADDVPSTLKKLWGFLGLPNKLKHPDILGKAFNTGGNNGIQSSDSADMALGKSYPPMTARSREILCDILDYWTRLSYFVNRYQIELHRLDFDACPMDS